MCASPAISSEVRAPPFDGLQRHVEAEPQVPVLLAVQVEPVSLEQDGQVLGLLQLHQEDIRPIA